MKVKTSVTLSEDLVEALDRAVGTGSRSALIEKVLRSYLREQALEIEQQRDRALIDEGADELNAEAFAVLDIQNAWLDAEP